LDGIWPLLSREIVPMAEFLEQLDDLRKWLQREINFIKGKWTLGPARSPPNASKLERDWWMARLVTIWRDDCGLDEGSGHLGRFILAATEPIGGSKCGSRAVKAFLARWRKGKVPEPGTFHFAGWGY
jgi:hypothetical protein